MEEPVGMGSIKQNNGKNSGEVLWETIVLPFFRISGAKPLFPVSFSISKEI